MQACIRIKSLPASYKTAPAITLLLLSFQNWIPSTTFRMNYDSSRAIYSAKFYLKFSSTNSVASIKLLDKVKSPRKFYKVAFTANDKITIFENLRITAFLLSRNEERLKNSFTETNPDKAFIDRNEYQGYWVT